MKALRKPTEMYRASVPQEARVVVPPEDDPEARGERKVTLVGVSGELFVGIDVAIQQKAVFDGVPKIGPDRDYTLPRFPTATTATFRLKPHQWIIAKAKSGFGQLTIIVEYLEGP